MALYVNGMFPGELTPDLTIAGCIDIFENVWPNPAETIKAVETECANPESGVYWTKAETIGQGAYQNARTNKLLPVTHLAQVSGNSLLQNLHNQFYTTLVAASVPYATRYGIIEGLYHEGYQLLRYENSQEYKGHYDSSTTTGRIISALIYLNDDFEGGELEFVHYKVKIKPQPGMLVLFPSNWSFTHIAHPVTKGRKYAMVTWIRDRAM